MTEPKSLFDPASMDWLHFGSKLGELLEAKLTSFVDLHPDDVFYGLAVTCDSGYGNIVLTANTIEGLRKQAIRYQTEFHYTETIEALMDDLRWSYGDWYYRRINVPRERWYSKYGVLFPDDGELTEEDDCEKFMEAACAALLVLEQSEAFKAMKKTPDFRTSCVDHDATVEDNDKRLVKVRSRLQTSS